MIDFIKWKHFVYKMNKDYAADISKTFAGRISQIFHKFPDRKNFTHLPMYSYLEKITQEYCLNPSFREPIRSLSNRVIEEAHTAMLLEADNPREPIQKLWKEYEILEETLNITHSNDWHFISCLDMKTAISPYFPSYKTLEQILKFVTHLYDTNIFKTNKVRQLPEYLSYAKIIMYILTDESILEILEEIREEYYAT